MDIQNFIPKVGEPFSLPILPATFPIREKVLGRYYYLPDISKTRHTLSIPTSFRLIKFGVGNKGSMVDLREIRYWMRKSDLKLISATFYELAVFAVTFPQFKGPKINALGSYFFQDDPGSNINFAKFPVLSFTKRRPRIEFLYPPWYSEREAYADHGAEYKWLQKDLFLFAESSEEEWKRECKLLG